MTRSSHITLPDEMDADLRRIMDTRADRPDFSQVIREACAEYLEAHPAPAEGR